MKTKQKIFYYSILLLAIVVLVNILADSFSLRLDLTEDNRYTLSRATKDIIRNIDEPVTVTAYFSEDLPPDIARGRRDFMEMLVEYTQLSDGNLVYEFIDPNRDEQTEQEAMQEGIRPVIIDKREKNEVVQKKAYLGAIIQKGEQKEVLPFIQPGAAMEYALSSSIKKLTVMDKPVIGFLQGHGEPALAEMVQVMKELEILYEPREINLRDSLPDTGFSTLVIIAPRDSFTQEELEWIRSFIEDGNQLAVALNRVEGDMTTATGKEIVTGLEDFLEELGIRIENNFLVDSRCAPVSVTQQQGIYTITQSINFPFIPILSSFARHPVTSGLEAVLMQFPSTLTFTGDSTWQYTPLVMSSEMCGTRPSNTYFDLMRRWTEADFPLSELVVGAALERNQPGKVRSRLVVFSDGDFPVNGSGEEARQIQPDNASLLVNSIDWLSDDTGLIELRTRGITARMLDPLEDGKKNFLKFLNFLLPMIIIILFGIYRIQYNRSLRIKRMEADYV